MDPTLWEEISAVEDRHWWFTARRSILLHLVSQLAPAGASVLDIGCGTGFMLEALAERFDAWGLEPEPAVRARTLSPTTSCIGVEFVATCFATR